MEEKLAKYRAQKQLEQQAERSWIYKIKKFLFSSKEQFQSKKSTDPANTRDLKPDPDNKVRQRVQQALSKDSSTLSDSENQENEFCGLKEDYHYDSFFSRKTSLIYRTLQFLLWLCVWGIFIELEFGSVYFVISLLCFIYFNTRTGPKKDDKLSAYSVFNKNFEIIQGTVTAEKLQNEMFSIPR